MRREQVPSHAGRAVPIHPLVPQLKSQSGNPRPATGRRVRGVRSALLLTLILGLGAGADEPLGASSHDAPTQDGRDHELSADSEAYRAARSLLPPGFTDHHTRRFVVISDANRRWTRGQAELLERTYDQFRRFTRRLELHPQPLRHKLVCVLFAQRRQYQQFAETHDGVTADWISGYYSPKHDRVVFYDLQSSDEIANADRSPLPPGAFSTSSQDRAALAPRRQSSGKAKPAPHPRGRRRGGNIDRNRLADDREMATTATTIHEAIHQLIFHTRIQSPMIQNPLWISEGLATAFETDRPNEAFGPAHEYAPRREQFRTLLAHNQLIGLHNLVQYTEVLDETDETVKAVYHQSYALVTWLSRFRRAELRDYLTALTAEPAGRPSRTRHLELFEQAFGDVDRLERAWLRYERDSLDQPARRD